MPEPEAPGNWFEEALAYATGKLHGATSALSPVGAGTMGQVTGYTAADYLIQREPGTPQPAQRKAFSLLTGPGGGAQRGSGASGDLVGRRLSRCRGNDRL